jgi:hypothetical protein
VSHGPERKEKNCLNCGTTVVGRYCHVCGQENLEPKETVWHLVTHFFNDITHFDGKFFVTLKYLLFKPGFLSREYMTGKRAKYLNPVRMYVFTSAIFFLVFFSLFQQDGVFNSTFNGKTLDQINKMDSTEFAKFTSEINKELGKPVVPMTRQEFKKYFDSSMNGGFFVSKQNFKTRKEYDSVLATGTRKDGWIMRQFIYKQIAINEKYKDRPQELLPSFKHTFQHSLPQMLFVSLPLLALILKLLYIRRRKQFYYVSHGIFSIHLYVFIFISMLVLFGLSRLNDSLHWRALTIISTILVIGLFVYEYLAMKNFYRQGWIKTFFKFLLANILFSIVVLVLFVLFILFSFFNI